MKKWYIVSGAGNREFQVLANGPHSALELMAGQYPACTDFEVREGISDHPYSVTGVTPEDFKNLYPAIEDQLEQLEKKRFELQTLRRNVQAAIWSFEKDGIKFPCVIGGYFITCDESITIHKIQSVL